METDDRLAQIRGRIQQANQEEARQELRREQALNEKTIALNTLAAEFEADTLDDAIRMRDKLKKEQAHELAALEKHLDTLGA